MIKVSVAPTISVVFGVFAIIIISGAANAAGLFLAPTQYRAFSLVFLLVIVYLTTPINRRNPAHGVHWYDLLFMLAGVAGAGYVALFYESRIVPYSMFGYLDPLGIFLTISLALSLLEGLRRMTGWVLPILTVIIVMATYWQDYLPGLLSGSGFNLNRLTYALYVGNGGIFGTPFAIATSIIVVFLIFAALLQRAGAGQWFTDVATALTGASRGGPAKAAVVSSALLGSISGSPSANTATSGAFTIPLMKQTGYRASFAGAVEAVASTGGMVLPPVMGAVAFIMAQLLGVPYAEVAIAAIIPALLYFSFVLLSVHFRACADGLAGLPKSQLAPIVPTIIRGWRFVLPIGTLIYVLLVLKIDPQIAALYSFPVLIVCSFFTSNREQHLTPTNIALGIVDGIRNWRIVALVTASVGMFIGALNLSGLGIKISDFIVDAGAGSLILTLLLVGVASLILGAGLEIVPLYLTLVILTAPALVDLGLSPMQAHLYVVFWGLASFITPPVCTAVYVACSISGSNIWATGGQAMRLGLPIFFVPVLFAFNPALIMDGSAQQILVAVSLALLAGLLLSASVQGYLVGKLSWPQRMALLVAGGLLASMELVFVLVGVGAALLTFVWSRAEWWGGRKPPSGQKLTASERAFLS